MSCLQDAVLVSLFLWHALSESRFEDVTCQEEKKSQISLNIKGDTMKQTTQGKLEV